MARTKCQLCREIVEKDKYHHLKEKHYIDLCNPDIFFEDPSQPREPSRTVRHLRYSNNAHSLTALRLGFFFYFSSRVATCGICQAKIAKNELRVWVRYPYPAFGMIAHPSCISKDAREIAKWAKDIERNLSVVLK